MTSERYDRQSRLPEIGDAGQSRLAAARVRVRSGDGAEIEYQYLVRAGIGHVEIAPDEAPEPFPHAGAFASEPALAIAAAAWRALFAIRRELGIHR